MPPVTYGDLLCVERIGGIDYYDISRCGVADIWRAFKAL